MLNLVLKIFVVGISVGAIYASCTGLHGISFDVMTERSWVRYRKVGVWSFDTTQHDLLVWDSINSPVFFSRTLSMVWSRYLSLSSINVSLSRLASTIGQMQL